MEKENKARLIVDKIKGFLGFRYDKELASYLEISPPSISDSVNDGRIPFGWVKKIADKKGYLPDEILRSLNEVESATLISRDEIQSSAHSPGSVQINRGGTVNNSTITQEELDEDPAKREFIALFRKFGTREQAIRWAMELFESIPQNKEKT